MEREKAKVIDAGATPAGTPRRAVFDVRELVAIFLGGTAGALARAGLVEALPARPGTWPWATFIVNIAAAGLLGYLITRMQAHPPPRRYRSSLLGTGVCGALSTFSTMMLELLRMIDAGDSGLALGYASASIAGGLAVISLATLLVRRGEAAR